MARRVEEDEPRLMRPWLRSEPRLVGLPRLLRPAEHSAVGRAACWSLEAAHGVLLAEEVLVGVAKKMPYNAEAEMKRRGARYEKAFVPFVSYIVVDNATGEQYAMRMSTRHLGRPRSFGNSIC
jgi:hypothetical protein